MTCRGGWITSKQLFRPEMVPRARALASRLTRKASCLIKSRRCTSCTSQSLAFGVKLHRSYAIWVLTFGFYYLFLFLNVMITYACRSCTRPLCAPNSSYLLNSVDGMPHSGILLHARVVYNSDFSSSASPMNFLRMLLLLIRSSIFSGARLPLAISPCRRLSSFAAYSWLAPILLKTLT